MDEFSIKPIEYTDSLEVSVFLSVAGSSLDSFRYFNTRPLSVLKNHLLTCLLYHKNLPIGYGHLDVETDKIWLGIALAETYTGQGLGKKIMNFLMNFAIENDLKEIYLSVDIANVAAINLYKSFGFMPLERVSDKYDLMKYAAG